MKCNNFSSSFDLIFSNVEGSLDFVFFKSGGSFFKTFLESVKHGCNFLVDVTNKIGGVNSGFERFGIKSTNFVIKMIRFSSSRTSVINISDIISGLSILWKINTLRLDLLEEFVDGLSFEHMFVFSKFTGVFTFNLSEDWSFTSSFTSSKFSSKDINSIKSVLVFFELHNEKLVGLTS